MWENRGVILGVHMGQFAGFVVRAPMQEIDAYAERLKQEGARDLNVYPELGLITGIIKGSGDGEIAIKLAKMDVAYCTLGQIGAGTADDRLVE